ncbi:MAG: site-2 protease family protein [Verrucomicrobia bacterium]|nr:site-2 protease family protein [Verrucomicrobiota bacterium]
MEFITTTVTILLLGIPAVLIGLYLAEWILLVIHELGHALAGWFMGLEVVEIRLGFGTKIFARRFGRLSVCIAKYPLCGWVLAFPPVKAYRIRWFLVVLGGPLASALAYVFLVENGPLKAWYFEWSWTWVLYAFQRTVRYMSLWTLLVTLWPRRCRLYGQNMLSDGLELLRMFLLEPAEATREAAYLQANRARALSAEGKRDEAAALLREAQASPELEVDLAFHANIAAYHAEQGRVDEAMRTLRELLPKAEDDSKVCAEVADAFCSVVIYAGLAAELPEAEQIIRKAIERCPDEISLNVSLGGILYERGHYEEAHQILKAVNWASREPLPLGQALMAACLAHLSLRDCDVKGAWSYAKDAKIVCPDHPLVKRLLDLVKIEVTFSS